MTPTWSPTSRTARLCASARSPNPTHGLARRGWGPLWGLRWLSCLTIFALAWGLPGCAQPDKLASEALRTAWLPLRPYTEAGIARDETITPESRAIRLRLVVEFSRLIEEGVAHGR
jgi:hypothetical protein